MDPGDVATIMADLTEHIYFDYGLAILMLVILGILVIPPLIKRGAPGLFASLAKDADLKRKREEQAIIDAAAREERQVKALEDLAKANQSIALAMARLDVRQSNMQNTMVRGLDRMENKLDKAIRE